MTNKWGGHSTSIYLIADDESASSLTCTLPSKNTCILHVVHVVHFIEKCPSKKWHRSAAHDWEVHFLMIGK